jgi:hypothetical protein
VWVASVLVCGIQATHVRIRWGTAAAASAVAAGAGYRAAAEAARRRAERVPAGGADQRPERRRDPARGGQLVASWADVFSELVCADELTPSPVGAPTTSPHDDPKRSYSLIA